MQFSKNPLLNLLICATCQGGGYVGYRRCSECRGKGLGRLVSGTFLYFGEPLTRYHIAVRKGRRILNRFRFVGALIFSLGFWGIFFWVIYHQDSWMELFSRSFWFETQAPVKALLWLGVISFSYLYYRILVMDPPPDEIIECKSRPGKDEELDAVLSWLQVRKLGKKKKIDIADTFTNGARLVLEDAFSLAYKLHNSIITPQHIFYALLASSSIASVFVRMGISVKLLQAKVAAVFEKCDLKYSPVLSLDVQQILFHAYSAALATHDSHVREIELLIAAVRQSEPLQELLYDLKVDSQKLTNVIEWVRVRERLREQYTQFRKAAAKRNKYGLDRAMTAVATPYLNSFSQDLTLMAKFGHLSLCIARDEEIDEIFRIIEGGRQSVILVGEHGVGKMSIIEGIAQRMVEERVPDRIKDKRLVQLSTSTLLAGTTASGAQERLIRIMRELGRAGNIILFIHNLHDLIGVSDAGGEGLDVSETLAEYLGPGKFLTLATTVPEAYNRQIVNTEVGKVIAKVEVPEMNENQAIQVLESKVGSTEYKQRVFFSYDSLEQCVKMAIRFLHDQNLPESAMSIMAEVASYVRNNKGENQLVSAEDVGVIVSQKTGIPATSISEDESAKLLRLEEEMHKRVVGQSEAVSLIANSLRRARAEIRSKSRPIANFLFLGPTGVGKTELAKTIAEVYFGGENRMIRIDMSEYQDKSGIYRLIGQPGQQGTGILTEAVRQQPFSLVLLDELEKADPDVLNLFLQVFDDARLTDSVGRVIDFTNVIIIATSNAGTSYVQDQLNGGVSLTEIREQMVHGELKKYYRPEFLNRFDGIVLFKPLTREEIKQIAGYMLKRVAKDLETRGVELRVEDAALEALVKIGFDPDFGARPMRRAIQEQVENKLAELILQNKLRRRDVVMLGEGAELSVVRENRS